MAEQEVLSKPQTIRVGVQGFSAFEAKPDTAAPAIDWPNETPLGVIKDQKK